jgi:hypothetical protein
VSTQPRRPGGSETAAEMRLARSALSVPLALVDFVVRIALDGDGLGKDGRRPYLDDMPARSRLIVDVTACRNPAPSVVLSIHAAMRRGVQIEIVTDSTHAARLWHDALGRVA